MDLENEVLTYNLYLNTVLGCGLNRKILKDTFSFLFYF